MDQNEKSGNKFWTLDMILLAILNVTLILGILFGLSLMYLTFTVPITTWLTRTMGL